MQPRAVTEKEIKIPAAINDGRTTKERYFEKKHREAPLVECACGCGEVLKSLDRFARKRTYINGHSNKKYHGSDSNKRAADIRWRDKNPDKVRAAKRNFYRSRKLQAMRLLGNYCFHCGLEYNGSNAPVFEFHHVDPAFKESGITRILINKAWETVLIELQKCDLLCRNCHMQHHGGEW